MNDNATMLSLLANITRQCEPASSNNLLFFSLVNIPIAKL